MKLKKIFQIGKKVAKVVIPVVPVAIEAYKVIKGRKKPTHLDY